MQFTQAVSENLKSELKEKQMHLQMTTAKMSTWCAAADCSGTAVSIFPGWTKYYCSSGTQSTLCP